MHSGADVEAFQAALNRDIGGDASTSQPSDSDNGTVFSNSINFFYLLCNSSFLLFFLVVVGIL
jgi:hypothetical protein